MAKQKVVIQVVSMNCAKSRARAMKIAVSTPGMVSVKLQGDSKNQIMITGEGIDSAYLTMRIRKNIGFTEIVSVTAVEEKKEEKKETKSIFNDVPIQ